MPTTVTIQRDTFANFAEDNAIIGDGVLCLETDTGKLKIGDGTNHYLDLTYILESITPDVDYRKIKIRRDTLANWTAVNPVPLDGEFCLETDTGKLKIGDGSNQYLNLPYFLSSGMALLSDIIFSNDKKTITISDSTNHEVSRPLPGFGNTLEYNNETNAIYLKDQNGNTLGNGVVPANTTYGQGTPTFLGLTKLYNEFGNNYDGAITQALATQFCIPTGTVIWYAGGQAPYGYIICNGQPISRTTYSTLFSAIGTAYGAGDGSTTFNIPLLTDGRYIQGSTTIAAYLEQSTVLPQHDHSVNISSSQYTWTHSHSGYTNWVTANHSHAIHYSNVTVSTYPWGHITFAHIDGNGGGIYYPDGISNNHIHPIYAETNTHGHEIYVTVNPNGFGSIVRPKSLTLLPCIKY